jgi:hypothetical protein
MANEIRNEIIKNVKLFWAKLDKPVDPFGTLQWELQVRFGKDRVEEMEQYGTVKPVKDEKGVFQLNLKKKAVKADGDAAVKPAVVNRAGEAIDPKTLGNGSEGNVKVMLKDYEIKGPKGNVTKRGTSVMLSAVQVTKLIKYEPKGGVDFDFEDVEDEEIPEENFTDEADDEQEEAPAPKRTTKKPAAKPAAKAPVKAAAKKPAGRPRKNQMEDDDIPF